MKSKTLARIFVVPVLIGALCSTPALCFEKATHQAINQNIASRTIGGFSLNEYLINVLGFEKGIDEPLWGYYEDTQSRTRKTITWWLGYGGVKEDEPEGLRLYLTNLARNNNHFHDPLRSSWDSAGFV